MDFARKAKENLARLAANPYPGRGIIVGLDETGKFLVQVYWIMGRSEGSRNRIFANETWRGRVFTELADTSKGPTDTSLIVYDAMLETKNVEGKGAWAFVSNGRQTNIFCQHASFAGFIDTSCALMYEPDGPHFTPRISTAARWKGGRSFAIMSVVRRSPWSDSCDRSMYEISSFGQGYGHCVHTYLGDDHPLPPFQGEPYLVPLPGDIDRVAEIYWGAALNPENKVSLAVKFIPREGGPSVVLIINKYSKVGIG